MINQRFLSLTISNLLIDSRLASDECSMTRGNDKMLFFYCGFTVDSEFRWCFLLLYVCILCTHFFQKIQSRFINSVPQQWRIQDFPEVGAPTPQGGANIRFCQNFPKTAWNWKNLDPQGGASKILLCRSTTAQSGECILTLLVVILVVMCPWHPAQLYGWRSWRKPGNPLGSPFTSIQTAI